MNLIEQYLAEWEGVEAELAKSKAKHDAEKRNHPNFQNYVKHWAGEHKAGRDRDGKKAMLYGVTKDDTKTYNDAKKKSLKEDAAPANVVSGGSIATKEQPIGDIQKRKPLDDAEEAEARMFRIKQDKAADAAY